jgi:mono/diheme cytochrome c family protein
MNHRKFLIVMAAVIGILAVRCGSNTNQSTSTKTDTTASATTDKGVGKFTNVTLTHPLDQAMASKGEAIYTATCSACHKVTDEKLVGPGWKGVTDRRTPEWIMNFITNTSVMLDKDLIAQKEMVTCVVRMPSQNLSDDQARAMLEFMRKNDDKN